MLGIFFLILLGLSFGVFFFRKKSGYLYSLLLVMGMVALTTHGAVQTLNGNSQSFVHGFNNIFRSATDILVLDGLSAFFILVINITLLVGLLYANGYLKPYHSRMGNLRFAVHYFSYIWLYFSMLLVVMLRNGVLFLIAWEMMAISSFFLVIFDADNRNILKTGINYLVQMHVGMLFILVGFLLVEKSTGSMSFDSLPTYFANSSNWPLFLLFFIGFAIKAGFMPLHTWLPEAHPAAPSHVSGVMSGVMIKMGIYGIFRVVLATQSDLLIIGVLLLAVSLISGLLGVIYAILQHDLKRLLAYHSIENIGIIGIGLGLGIIGKATNNQMLMLLGFSGALLHTLNHSLFKSCCRMA
jgi:hydrogenase-4 component B